MLVAAVPAAALLLRAPLHRCRRVHAIATSVSAADWAAAPLQLTVRRAQSPAELRAAGSLRAAAFSVVPPDRSEFARQVGHRCHLSVLIAAMQSSVLPDTSQCSRPPSLFSRLQNASSQGRLAGMQGAPRA